LRAFAGIQAMRGVAAFSVALGHALNLPDTGIDHSFGFAVLCVLQAGVDVFFVISGFIIAHSATEIAVRQGRLGAFSFAAKRIERIYPLYWIVLTTAFVASLPLPIPGLTFQGLHVSPVEPSASVPSIIFLTTTANHYVSVAWTLCYEVSFYAAVTFVILVAPKYIIETIIVAVGILAVLDLSMPRLPGIIGSPMILEFGFGVIIAFVIKRGVTMLWPLSIAAGLSLLTLGAAGQVSMGPLSEMSRAATCGAGSAFLIYAIVASELRGARFPGWLQYLGDISYSLYLWHYLILVALAALMIKRLNGWIPGPILIALWLIIIVAVAAASHRYIEQRFSKLPRRWLAWMIGQRPRTVGQAPAGASTVVTDRAVP
jgi:exopolysaccharide production protein ExoZ